MLLLRDDRIGLTLVGDYDEHERHFVQSSPIASNILFLGERPEAMRYMAASDVYVLPSWRDASPRVVREAMSLSLPTIVSDIPGSRDLILPGETGLLAPAQDPEALAKAILWMLEHPEERRAMGCLGRERIARDFSPERYTEIFADLFRSLAV
jgi:glycosyltransferase family 4